MELLPCSPEVPPEGTGVEITRVRCYNSFCVGTEIAMQTDRNPSTGQPKILALHFCAQLIRTRPGGIGKA